MTESSSSISHPLLKRATDLMYSQTSVVQPLASMFKTHQPDQPNITHDQRLLPIETPLVTSYPRRGKDSCSQGPNHNQ
jgi:hypothetical protein